MPNNCNHKITIAGPVEDVAAFVEAARGAGPNYVLSELEQRFYGHGPHEARDLDFDALVPLPQEALGLDRADGKGSAERALWGCDGRLESRLVSHEPGAAHYTLWTAWRSPKLFFVAASVRHPRVTIFVSFGEEYPTRGRYIVQAGKLVSETHDEPLDEWAERETHDCEKDDWSSKSPCTQCDQNMAWRDQYLTEHDGWVARETARAHCKAHTTPEVENEQLRADLALAVQGWTMANAYWAWLRACGAVTREKAAVARLVRLEAWHGSEGCEDGSRASAQRALDEASAHRMACLEALRMLDGNALLT